MQRVVFHVGQTCCAPLEASSQIWWCQLSSSSWTQGAADRERSRGHRHARHSTAQHVYFYNKPLKELYTEHKKQYLRTQKGKKPGTPSIKNVTNILWALMKASVVQTCRLLSIFSLIVYVFYAWSLAPSLFVCVTFSPGFFPLFLGHFFIHSDHTEQLVISLCFKRAESCSRPAGKPHFLTKETAWLILKCTSENLFHLSDHGLGFLYIEASGCKKKEKKSWLVMWFKEMAECVCAFP